MTNATKLDAIRKRPIPQTHKIRYQRKEMTPSNSSCPL
jgi:hypothetical protein